MGRIHSLIFMLVLCAFTCISVCKNHFNSNTTSSYSTQQAAGVKRLLFCGVGCQVQGLVDFFLFFFFKFLCSVIFFVVICTIVMQSNFLNCSTKICGAPFEFGKALCLGHQLW